MRLGAYRGWAVLLVCAAMGLSACGGGKDKASPPTTSSTTTSTAVTSTTTVEEKAVLDAYQGYWKAILAANDPPDQFNPDLKKYATGDAYTSVFNAAQANRVQGHALRLPPDSRSRHDAKVMSVANGQATVSDCAVDDGLVVNIATGEVLNNEVTTRRVTATLLLVEGAWKVSTTHTEESWKGVAGCAASE